VDSTDWTPEQLELLERVRNFTPEERAAALEATRARLNLTPEERDELLERNARTIDWIAAADTPEEQERRGAQAWAEQVERPRMARRIAAAFRAKLRPVAARAPRRTNGPAGRPRAAATRSSSRSGDSPDDGDSEPPPPRQQPPTVRPWSTGRDTRVAQAVSS
jgi:hypothetical protein